MSWRCSGWPRRIGGGRERGDWRRPWCSRTVGLFLALGLVLTGCGGSNGAPDGAAPADNEGPGAFPVTITHAKGTTEIPAKPQRVVALGYTDIAVAHALDAPLVGAVAPPSGDRWAAVTPPLPNTVTSIDSSAAPSLEQIAALQPDLILMTTGYPSYQKAYQQLSQIAPTVTYKNDYFQGDPRVLTRMIGKALGKIAAAERLIAQSQRAIDNFLQQHPQVSGHSIVFAQTRPGQIYVIVPPARSTRFFGQLGLRVPNRFTQLGTPGPSGAVGLSNEKIDLLDTADIAFILDAASSLKSNPLFQELSLPAGLHEITVDTGVALQEANPANTRYLLTKLGPELAKLPAAVG